MRFEKFNDEALKFINSLLLGFTAFMAIIPLLATIATSFSTKQQVERGVVSLLPKDFTLASWEFMIYRSDLWKAFFLTLVSTILGTILALLITSLIAYPLAKKQFKIGKYIMIGVVVTMVFKYPIIPYFLTVKGVGLYNNILVLIIPHLVSAYNLVIMRTFFQQYPIELEEAGLIEGCGYFQMLIKLVLPSSKAVLATLALFYGVVIWNQFQHPLMFIQNPDLFPLQMKIRQFITDSNEFDILKSVAQRDLEYNESTLKATVVLFSLIPVITIYPFVQKHFVKGAMLGSVKG